ncbi:MAG: hypothetical protein VX723_04500 [Candidatus Thermoplasmatota archaeon]|nr:hypothetical protein [Candidatus Thermoplasmatota archaeon]
MGPRQSTIAIVVLATMLLMLPSANAESQDPPIIGFDFENGLSMNESRTLSGSIESDSVPDSVDWTIAYDSYSLGGQISDSLQETNSQSERMTWSWYVELNISQYPICTCYFTITVSIGESSWTESRVVFIGDSMRSGLLIESPEEGEWAHDFLIVSGWSSHPTVWANPEIRFFTYPVDSSANTCSEEGDSDTTPLLSVSNAEGEFYDSLDISSLGDGWYSLYVENYDPSRIAFTQKCVSIRVNNAFPDIILSVEDLYIESPDELLFDASASDDLVWGREGMEYMWVLRKPSHSGQTPIDIQLGGGIYSMSSDSGGNYTLTLTLTDSGGVKSTSVFEIDIENVVPTAIATIDSSQMIDGDRIKLSNGEQWFLDASDSTDSTNDLAQLKCVWKIDYEPVYEGCQRELSWPSQAGDEIILTLEVIDDDEDYGSISVKLIHPDASEPLPYHIIVLVTSSLFMLSAIFLRYRSSDDSAGIPSWDSESDK